MGDNLWETGANTAYGRVIDGSPEQSRKAPGEGLAAHQLVGVVTAHLGYDG